MTTLPDPNAERIAKAQFQRPTGVVLKGQFTEVLRSPKGKVKGIQLRTATQTYAIKLPKYLRPMLVRELTPLTFVEVWAYPDEQKWRGINVAPLPDREASALQAAWQAQGIAPAIASESAEKSAADSPLPSLCVQVCRKGKCFKRGSREIMRSLEAAIAADSQLQNVSVVGVGCMKACKKGPNIKLSNSSKVIGGVTPDNILALVQQRA
ncbi:MAG: (2Fe-2S) ferredoxin domain-containing protein [Cyanobacteria bacterium P01_H01_bin.119]